MERRSSVAREGTSVQPRPSFLASRPDCPIVSKVVGSLHGLLMERLQTKPTKFSPDLIISLFWLIISLLICNQRTRFGAWPHWNNFHQPYWLHGHHVLGSKPYYYSSAAEADPFLRTRAQSVTGASILQGCSSYQNDRSTDNQIRLLRDEENNHDPLDLELTLDIGPRRDKRIKRSRSSWGREDEENVDRDQEVESATDTGLSLSFFSSP